MRWNLSAYRFVVCCLFLFGISGFLLQSSGYAGAKEGSGLRTTYPDLATSRPYFVYTPPNYHVGEAVPLIVMLHGCAQTANDFAVSTQMNQLADRYMFIVVYPQQLSIYNQDLCWNWFESGNQTRGKGEAAIIAGIVRDIEQNVAQWTIDRQRVYVAGFSAGASMAVILGATYPDIFAAIGVHSGLEYQAAMNAIDSAKAMSYGGPNPEEQGHAALEAMGTNTRVMPTIVFQGTSDDVVHAINGDQVVLQWMQTDRLASNGIYTPDFEHPTSVENGQVLWGHTYSVFRWNDNHGSEIQEYWTINGMGHAWSGGSPGETYTDPSGPDASFAMVQFFLNHAMNV